MARTSSMLNSTLDLSIPGTASMFDEASLWAARFGALMLDHLEIRDDVDVLDVGCGTGLPLIELAALHGGRSRFTGVDTWAGALERARAKIAWMGTTHVKV